MKVPFSWKADTWYRVKLQIENLPDGKVRARGKAWLATEAEPANWMIERVDPNGNRMGSAGVFAYALPLKLNILVAIAAAVIICLGSEKIANIRARSLAQ